MDDPAVVGNVLVGLDAIIALWQVNAEGFESFELDVEIRVEVTQIFRFIATHAASVLFHNFFFGGSGHPSIVLQFWLSSLLVRQR